MLSIGDWIDKLVIENIKIFNVREKLLTTDLSDEDYVELYLTMMKLVESRAKLSNALDTKIKNVVSRKEKNNFIERIRTYNE